MSETPKPTTLIRYFSDLDVCTDFVAKMRWPNGPFCPRCGCVEHSYLTTRRVWKCKGCKKQYSAKLETIFEDSALGFDKWLPAIWLIANSKNGISSHELARSLGTTQKSAWFMLHRIRLAMQTGSFDKLDGEIEADETYIGGKARNMHAGVRKRKITGTGGKDKTAVFGVQQRAARPAPRSSPTLSAPRCTGTSVRTSSLARPSTRTFIVATTASMGRTRTRQSITPSATSMAALIPTV